VWVGKTVVDQEENSGIPGVNVCRKGICWRLKCALKKNFIDIFGDGTDSDQKKA